MVLALDLGSTQWKAAIGDESGIAQLVRADAPFARGPDGSAEVSADSFAVALQALIALLPMQARSQVREIVLTGMAEGGVLLARDTLWPLSTVMPWYDTRPMAYLSQHAHEMDIASRYAVTGLPASYKYGAIRLLDALERTGLAAADVCWLGVIDYAALLLTDRCFTDASLAARTYAYRLDIRQWDDAWLSHMGLSSAMFSPVLPSSEAGGTLTETWASQLTIPAHTPVRIAGHDHLCAAYGAGIAETGAVYGSLGTAQVLLGVCPGNAPTGQALDTGLSFGPYLERNTHAVLGSIQSAGGAIAWAKRALFGDASYDVLLREIEALPGGPSGLLFYPYLNGSGAPHLDADARGAFIGLTGQTTRALLLLAIYEGIAMESRLILETPAFHGKHRLLLSGGLTRHARLMQIFADVTGMDVRIASEQEGTLYGAIRLALARQGKTCPAAGIGKTIVPSRHAMEYGRIYRQAYLPLIAPLRSASEALRIKA